MNFFYILSGPLGYVMEWIYKLLPSYGWDIIIFTLLINIVKIPLQLSQQKSMAKMSAFQPMMMEIQTKYKDKPEKQQEEMLKLQQDYGYSPTAGCVPMLLNFLVMFGVIGVVYNPLERIFHISAAALTAAGEALTASGVAFTAITRDTNIIAQVVAGNGGVLGCFSAEQIATITEFSQHMNFLGIDLTRIPKLGLSLDIVLPLLSVITMLLSTHISMKASGQQMQGSMKLTMYMMPLMYLFFCFTYPLAFSLYYVISNIVMTVQTQVMRKVYDPDKMRKEIEAQIAEKKKQEKRGVKNTTVKVTDPKTGKTTEKNLSASEMNIEIKYEDGSQQVYLNETNVTGRLRTEEVGNMASKSSALPCVREKLLSLQRELAAKNDVVMDGRDIGTNILPNAELKIYLTASVEIRARRRYDELVTKGETNLDRRKIEQDIAARDKQDMERKIAPLKKADDAVLVDSSDMDINEVAETIIRLAKERE